MDAYLTSNMDLSKYGKHPKIYQKIRPKSVIINQKFTNKLS